MLKIKDEIDLKELKKFGFNYSENINCFRKTIESEFVDIDDVDYFIDKDKKILEINTNNQDFQLDTTIYDLIQAGLVEKIEDEIDFDYKEHLHHY